MFGPMGAMAVNVAGSGPLVVLVHGTAPPAWGTLHAALAIDHRVVTYRRRSFSPEPGATVRSLGVHTDDLVSLIEHFGPPATIVGWSIGGVIGSISPSDARTW